MKITTFNPLILSKDADEIVKLKLMDLRMLQAKIKPLNPHLPNPV